MVNSASDTASTEMFNRELFDRRFDGSELQDLEQRGYFGRGAPNEARIDWAWPARRIRALVRACDYGPFSSPWGRTWTASAAGRLEVLEARLTGYACDSPPGAVRVGGEGAVMVATGDEWLALQRVRRGARTAPASEILSHGEHLGTVGEGGSR